MATFNTCGVCGQQQPATSSYCSHCGNPLPGLGTGLLPPNFMLQGRYIIVNKLGQGGMGAVYKVADQRIGGKILAVKEMSDAAIIDPNEKAQAIAAFEREAQLLARLDHPNIPKITDFFTENQKHYMVMEFVPGETLEDRMMRQPAPCNEQQVRDWALQLCDVLSYLHNQHPPIIFRDLKPGNIMLTPQRQIKLIDFGIARFFKPGQPGDTQVMGTPGYAPPEQHGHGQTDARSDIYALGVTLHHLLTCHDPTRTPFSLPPVRQLNPNVSSALEQIITQATQTDIGQRYQSIGEMRQALGGALPPPAPPLPHPQPVAKPSRGVPVWAVLMGLVMVVVLVLGLGVAIASTVLNRTQPTPAAPIVVMATAIQTPIRVPTALAPGTTPGVPAPAPPLPTTTPAVLKPVQATSTSMPARPPPATTPAAPNPVHVPPTRTPTHPPTRTPTPPPCRLATDRQLTSAWDRGELGCPETRANVIWAAWQPFERGYMLWRSDTQHITVFYGDNTWTEFPDQWTEGAYIPSRGSPPAGQIAPIRGFGYLWGTHDDIANRLGWASEGEQGFCANIQAFEQGFIFHSSTVLHCQDELYNWATHPDFAPLFFGMYGDGSWKRY